MAKILVVDDRPVNRDLLVKLLGYLHHTMFEAADGSEALGVVRAERPDLVIADILMPTMDGYEFVRQLRAEADIAATPVIFCTAHYHEQEARALATACGVRHVLTKPVQPEVVLRIVDAALGVSPPPAAPPAPTEEFDREHLRLLTDKLSQKADELRKANDRLAALVALGLDLGAERDADRLLRTFCDTAREIIGARYAAVGVLGASERHLRHYLTSGMDPATAACLGTPDPRQGVLGTILDECHPRRLHQTEQGSGSLGLPPSLPPCRSFLGAPLVSPTRVYGWFCLFDKIGAEEFSLEDERLAGILAAQLGRIYENGSLYADVVRHAGELEREVAERRQLEDRLRKVQQRLQHVVVSSPAVLFTLAVEGEDLRPTWISENVQEMLGYAVEEVSRPSWWQSRLHPEEVHRVVADIRNALVGPGRHAAEYRFRHQDGTYRWLRMELRLLRDTTGTLVEAIGSWSDVTERRLLEDQLRQAQKMEAVGQLAGGVAHDFNNLLTVITGYGELLLERLAANDPTREVIREMVSAGGRAASLTRQLLAFSRKAILEPRVLDLGTLVTDMDKLLRRIIGEDIHLVTAADPELSAVKADPGHLEQVILNLAVNARDAMPRGGRLTIEARNTNLDEVYARSHLDARPGPHVLLAVTDTGIGMNRETMARIFEPFFSTKGERGTGLGLATVYGIIKQSGGHIAVYSEEGHGTTFKVYLPRVDERPTTGRSHLSLTAMPRGSETVLVVEDEDGVRALTRHVLLSCGYNVLEARDGIEATRLAGQHPGRIDLLMSDVVMPRMGGREVAGRLMALCPGLKVLFVSGYTDDAVVRHGILEAEVAFLQKPFSPASLAAKVREVLDG